MVIPAFYISPRHLVRSVQQSLPQVAPLTHVPLMFSMRYERDP
jgi:hypothetical protein